MKWCRFDFLICRESIVNQFISRFFKVLNVFRMSCAYFNFVIQEKIKKAF